MEIFFFYSRQPGLAAMFMDLDYAGLKTWVTYVLGRKRKSG